MATTNSWTPETLAEMLSMGGEHINSYTPPTLEGMELSGPYPTPDPEAVRYRRWRFPCYTVLVHGTEQDVNQILPDSWSLHARIDYQYSRGGRRIYLWDSVPRVKFLADGEQLPPLWPSKSESIFYRRFPDQPCQEWRKSFSLPLAISDDNSLTFTPQSLDVMMGRPDASSPQVRIASDLQRSTMTNMQS